MEGDDAVAGLAARTALALTETGLFVPAPARSTKSESLYLQVFTRSGAWLGVVRISTHAPGPSKPRWLHLAPGGNWARVVIELAKRARLTPPPAVFREDERWKSDMAPRQPSRGRNRRSR